MPSYFKEEEIHGHAEGERLVVKTGASSVAQNESYECLAGMRVRMSARANGEVLLSTLRL
jgi:hypothetical protein